jgi:hypothetical protein
LENRVNGKEDHHGSSTRSLKKKVKGKEDH